MGQRVLSSILLLVLLVVGALLTHQPGAFPALAASGNTITPDVIVELLGKIVAPALALLAIVRGLFLAINAKVVDGSLDPTDVIGLFRLPQFWTAVISTIVGIVQMFTHVVILDEASQAVLVTSILGIVGLLLNSLGQRVNKSETPTDMIVTGQAHAVRR